MFINNIKIPINEVEKLAIFLGFLYSRIDLMNIITQGIPNNK